MDVSGIAELASTAVRTAIVLAALVMGIRLFGKRHIGEMNLYDILMVLIMANAVQNAMTKGNGSVGVALISASTLILLGRLFASMIARFPSVEKHVTGSAVVLAYDGQLSARNLRREEVTEDDLMAAIRKQGLSGIDDVRLAVLEVDGSISVIPKENDEKGEEAAT